MISERLQKEWEDNFKFCDEYQEHLTPKEEDFIFGEYGVKEILSYKGELSRGQSKWLRDIKNRISGLIG